MPEAISPKPFAVGVNRCHHRLWGTGEPYRQIFIKIKNGGVSGTCRFVVECPHYHDDSALTQSFQMNPVTTQSESCFMRLSQLIRAAFQEI